MHCEVVVVVVVVVVIIRGGYKHAHRHLFTGRCYYRERPEKGAGVVSDLGLRSEAPPPHRTQRFVRVVLVETSSELGMNLNELALIHIPRRKIVLPFT